MSQQDQEVLNHYIKLWGEPRECHRFEHPAAVPLQPFLVYVFSFSAPETWIYATLGARHQPMFIPDGKPMHMELFVMTSQADEDLVPSIGALALYPFVYQTYFGNGHTIHGSDGNGIVAQSPLTDILIIRPDFEEQTDYVHHDLDHHTHLLWVIPLYSQERVYAVQQGRKSLLEIFEEQEVDIYDLWRPIAQLPT
ncbi:suppressor of fused domain protein [Trichocoleus desertorum AS-A10]|uniref:suppressor of fused domain protein n=1 Tax=Trichocoleus desertorum TaxID=1481672 RepID=UPI003299A337